MGYLQSRAVARILHIVIALFQLVYIYTPLHTWSHALAVVQWVTFPLLVLTGLWMGFSAKLWPLLTRRKLHVTPASSSPQRP